MSDSTDISTRIERLDTTLFDAIQSQSSLDDRMSWLALQRAACIRRGSYSYLEIGSHLGGSMQSHLLDPRCTAIYSIDKRPIYLPDDRGITVHYPGNSTERMLENLRNLDAANVSKVHTFDGSVRDVNPVAIAIRPDLCFIDGEHTKHAVLDDFAFCLDVCSDDAVIYFHDSGVMCTAIAEAIEQLREHGRRVETAKLGGSTFAIGLQQPSLLSHETVLPVAKHGPTFLRLAQAKRAVKQVVPSPIIRPARAGIRWFRKRKLGRPLTS